MLYLGALFLAKVLDNALSTTKTILIQRSRWVLAGIAVILSDFIYFCKRGGAKMHIRIDYRYGSKRHGLLAGLPCERSAQQGQNLCECHHVG